MPATNRSLRPVVLRQIGWLLVFGPTLLACNPRTPQAYYRAVKSHRDAGPLVKTWRAPGAEVALKQARTLAFVAPKRCSARGQGRARTQRMRLDCRLLMAELEMAARKRGFGVVGWRSLVRAGQSPAQVAVTAGADLLVTVSERASRIDPATDLRPGKLRFLLRRVDATSSQVSLRVPSKATVAARCEVGFQRLTKVSLAASALVVEATELASGKKLWRYTQRYAPEQMPSGRFHAEQAVRVHTISTYPQVTTTAGLIVGAVLMVVPSLMDLLIDGVDDARRITPYTMSGGLGLVSVSLLGTLLVPAQLTTFPPPAPLLCKRGATYWLKPPPIGHHRAALTARRFARRAMQQLAAPRPAQAATP